MSRVSITTDPDEVRGRCCPACGRAAGIRRERHTRPYDLSDMLNAALFGLIGAAASASGRTRVRLRCPACRCLFPRPAGPVRRAVVWTLLSSAAILAAWFLGVRLADEAGAALGPEWTEGVAAVLRALSERPVAVTFAAGALLAIVLGTLLVSAVHHRNARMAAWRRRYEHDAALDYDAASTADRPAKPAAPAEVPVTTA